MIFSLMVILAGIASTVMAQPGPVEEHIKVDQFGYLPGEAKIAVVSNPLTGFNSSDSFLPGATYEVRRADDDAVVLAGAVTPWQGGAVHDGSGDQIWWFDFSSLDVPGQYYIYDPSNNVSSYPFEIGPAVFADVLEQAVRAFYYQRCGTSKVEPSAD